MKFIPGSRHSRYTQKGGVLKVSHWLALRIFYNHDLVVIGVVFTLPIQLIFPDFGRALANYLVAGGCLLIDLGNEGQVCFGGAADGIRFRLTLFQLWPIHFIAKTPPTQSSVIS